MRAKENGLDQDQQVCVVTHQLISAYQYRFTPQCTLPITVCFPACQCDGYPLKFGLCYGTQIRELQNISNTECMLPFG